MKYKIGNKSDQCMELDTAKKLEENKEIVFVRRYIGGMTDPDRGGYFNGERVENGDPKEVLENLLEEFPENTYLFTRDESGQFQTYFSVWKVTT